MWFESDFRRIFASGFAAFSSLTPNVRAMNEIARSVRPYLEPVVGVAFFALWVFAEAGRIDPFVVGMRGTAIAWIVLLGGVSLALTLSRLAPYFALALCAAVLIVQLLVWEARFTATSWPVYCAFLVVIAEAAARPGRRLRAFALWSAVAFGITVAGLLALSGVSQQFGWADGWRIDSWTAALFPAFLTGAAVCVVLGLTAWFEGFGVRAWMQQRVGEVLLEKTEDELRVAEVDLLIAGERDRIAQDVHDIMAHSLSVIIAQADGARFVAPSRPAAMSDSLEQIAAAARTSLTEVRMLIESLVDDPAGHSHPGIDDLGVLIERMRAAGLAVESEEFGEAASLTSTQELAVYRIVQEALTNALKHAGGDASARVVLDWRGTPGLALTITSNGSNENGASLSSRSVSAEPRGRGLYGMRERARLAGGWLTAAEDDSTPGAYIVTAFFPSLVPVESGLGTAETRSLA